MYQLFKNTATGRSDSRTQTEQKREKIKVQQLPLGVDGKGPLSTGAQTIRSGKLGGDPDRSRGMDGSDAPLTSPSWETDGESARVVKYTLQETEARGEAVFRGMCVTFSSRLGVDVDIFY